MDRGYYRHEGYGHGSNRKMVLHKIRETGKHIVTTACGKDLYSSAMTSEADIAPYQGEKTRCKRCFKGID